MIKFLSPSQNICLLMIVVGGIWLCMEIIAYISSKGDDEADTDGMYDISSKKTVEVSADDGCAEQSASAEDNYNQEETHNNDPEEII